MNKDELFKLNANNEALSYISGQLFDNTTKIESLINGGTK